MRPRKQREIRNKTGKRKNPHSKTHPYTSYVPLPPRLTPKDIHDLKLLLNSIGDETNTILLKQSKAVQVNFNSKSNPEEALNRIRNILHALMRKSRGTQTSIILAQTILWIPDKEIIQKSLLRFSHVVPSENTPIHGNLKLKRNWYKISEISVKDDDLYDSSILKSLKELPADNEESSSSSCDDSQSQRCSKRSDIKGKHVENEDASKMNACPNITINTFNSAKNTLLSVIKKVHHRNRLSESKIVAKLGYVFFEKGRSNFFNPKKSCPLDQFSRLMIGYHNDMKLTFNSAVMPNHALQTVRYLNHSSKSWKLIQPQEREIIAYIHLLDNREKDVSKKHVHLHVRIILTDSGSLSSLKLIYFSTCDLEKQCYITILKPSQNAANSVDLRIKFYTETQSPEIPIEIEEMLQEMTFDKKAVKIRIPRTHQGIYSFESIRYKEIKYQFECKDKGLRLDVVSSRDHENNHTCAEIEISPFSSELNECLLSQCNTNQEKDEIRSSEVGNRTTQFQSKVHHANSCENEINSTKLDTTLTRYFDSTIQLLQDIFPE